MPYIQIHCIDQTARLEALERDLAALIGRLDQVSTSLDRLDQISLRLDALFDGQDDIRRRQEDHTDILGAIARPARLTTWWRSVRSRKVLPPDRS